MPKRAVMEARPRGEGRATGYHSACLMNTVLGLGVEQSETPTPTQHRQPKPSLRNFELGISRGEPVIQAWLTRALSPLVGSFSAIIPLPILLIPVSFTRAKESSLLSGHNVKQHQKIIKHYTKKYKLYKDFCLEKAVLFIVSYSLCRRLLAI